MDEDLYLKFDRYLSNDMKPEERIALEKELGSDQDLAEKLRIYEQANNLLTLRYQSEEKENQFRQTLEVIANEELEKKQGRVIPLTWYYWSAAAGIAFLCAILFYTSFSQPAYSTYAHYEPLALVERGTGDTLKLKAQHAFNTGHYSEAVMAISQLLETDPVNESLKLYKGIALLELNRIKEAKVLFEEVSKTKSIYQGKAFWMLALSALKEKDYSACERFLKIIPEGASEYKQAQQLLHDL